MFGEPDDPHAAALTALYQRSLGQGLNLAAVHAMLGYAPVFGDLAGNATLAHALLAALESLQTLGVEGALVACNQSGPAA